MVEISLCMIVRDEEVNLEKSLSRIAGYMDEIIIVDTGSSDRTKEIARKYTESVFDYIWNQDFSAARNYSISKASNEYVLILDGDEFLQEIDITDMKRRIEEYPTHIGRILRINEYTRKGNKYRYQERVNRLFSKEYYQYQGIIHEQIILKEGVDLQFEQSGKLYNTPITLLHSGYEGDLPTLKKKSKRNIELLQNVLKITPEDPYILYQLGKSYYMEEDYISACCYFEEALMYVVNTRLEYVQDMVESYGYAMLNSGKQEEALLILNLYDEFNNSADFLFLVALILMNNSKFNEAITEFFKATQFSNAKMEGVNSYLSYYNIGVIYECMNQKMEAQLYYNKCGDYREAQIRLNELDKEI